jgi:putative ABC transport system permease protein
VVIRPAPRLARWWLQWQLPADVREDVVSNLDELHLVRARRRGQLAADLWFVRQALVFPLRVRLAGDAREPDARHQGERVMSSVIQDLRFAVRLHRAHPGVTLAALVSLTIGIGLNAAIFSVVDGVLLRPTAVANIDEVMMVWETDRSTGTTREPASVPDFVDFRRDTHAFAALGGLSAGEANFAPSGDDPRRVARLVVSHELLPMLGVTPLVGRGFTAADEQSGASLVLISERLRQSAFGAGTDVVGRSIQLDDRTSEIIGVVADNADFGILQVLGAAAYGRAFADRGTGVRVDVWQPLQPTASAPRDSHPLLMIGRLGPGVSSSQGQDEMTRLAAELETRYPEANTARGVFVEPLASVVFGPSRPALLALFGAVGLVLLVACVNVTNLLLARGTARSREISVRIALGAGTARVVRQLLTESIALAAVAAALGAWLAFGAVQWFATQGPATVPRLSEASVDLRVLLAMTALAVVVGIAFGLFPAWQALRTTPRAGLMAAADRTATGGRSGRRLRSTLVVAELALAVVLLVGAGLLVKSFWRLSQVDPGFDATHVVKAQYQLPTSRYPVNFATWPDFPEVHDFTRRLEARASALPGVQAAAIASSHPLDPGFTSSFSIVGRPPDADRLPEISVRRVTPGYFDVVGLTLREGRTFDGGDAIPATPVAVVNEAAAARFFPDRPAVGQAIFMWGAERRIVGVVANERFFGLTAAAPIAVYYPAAQVPGADGAGALLVRSDGRDAATVGAELRRAIRDIDPGLAVFGIEALDETLSQSVADRRFTMALLGAFALMALALAAVGVHSVLSYTVSEQTREIGIRIALGARPGNVRRRIVGSALVLAGAGVVVGATGALGLTGLMQALLFGVTPTDVSVFAAVAALLMMIAALASYVPARLATRIAPTDALRD